jgi:hypothetical protein
MSHAQETFHTELVWNVSFFEKQLQKRLIFVIIESGKGGFYGTRN